jgi:DNA-binding transcriptional LysR family regulator
MARLARRDGRRRCRGGARVVGQGVALCPLAIVDEDLREGRLVQLSDTTIREEFAYYIVTDATPEAQRAPGIVAFRKWLLSTASEVEG